MSDKLDYVNSRIERATQDKLDSLLIGNIKTIEELQFQRGYLKAMQDVLFFQQDYTSKRNPTKQEEEQDDGI